MQSWATLYLECHNTAPKYPGSSLNRLGRSGEEGGHAAAWTTSELLWDSSATSPWLSIYHCICQFPFCALSFNHSLLYFPIFVNIVLLHSFPKYFKLPFLGDYLSPVWPLPFLLATSFHTKYVPITSKKKLTRYYTTSLTFSVPFYNSFLFLPYFSWRRFSCTLL